MHSLYFSLFMVQPFADMAEQPVEGLPGVTTVTADGKTVGFRLDDVQMVVRLPEIIEHLGLEPERVWSRLHADQEVIAGRRAATWGGGGA